MATAAVNEEIEAVPQAEGEGAEAPKGGGKRS